MPMATRSSSALTKKRKRARQAEAEANLPESVSPAKRLRRLLPPFPHELSKENLQEDPEAEAKETAGLHPLEGLQELPQLRLVQPTPPPLHPSLGQQSPNGSVRKSLKLKSKLMPTI
jgi:hypothetical protein